MTVTIRQVVDALKHRYVGEEAANATVSTEDMSKFLRQIPEDKLPDDHTLLELVAAEHADWVPEPSDIAVLHSIRDCMTMIFNLIDLEDEVFKRIRKVTPVLAAELVLHPELAVRESEYSIFTILDLLLDATIGWSADQGRAGEKLLAEVDSTLTSLEADDIDFEALTKTLTAFLEKEQSRIKKLEERLAASETGKLRSQRSRTVAAEMINQEIEGKQLTAGIHAFLVGPWYESMQLLAINQGVDGDDWIRATKLTETIIWTYQPITGDDEEKVSAEKQRLYRIIEHLPGEIRELLLALAHNADEAEGAIAEIEDDHVTVVSGQELEYVEFESIETDGSALSQKTSVSRILLRKVNNLTPGQWFTYEDEDRSARIKLVLKLEDVKQMLFTNRNGMKALEKSFDEMAYLMSSSIIKPLNHEAVFSSTFTTFYQGLIEEHQRKLKLAEQADQEEAQKEAARQKALQEANALARAKEEAEKQRKEEEKQNRLERAKEEAAKSENQAKVAEFEDKVNALNIGAWLKLPAADGHLEECKLAVRVASADKFIFVSRTGVKVGEYTTEQLTTLLVAGEAEIDDTGVEFEDTLAQVVTKLRQDRNKSYDDLTGGE